jgi:hypothetical protein
MYVVVWFDGKSTQIEDFLTLSEANTLYGRVFKVDPTAKVRFIDREDHLNG